MAPYWVSQTSRPYSFTLPPPADNCTLPGQLTASGATAMVVAVASYQDVGLRSGLCFHGNLNLLLAFFPPHLSFFLKALWLLVFGERCDLPRLGYPLAVFYFFPFPNSPPPIKYSTSLSPKDLIHRQQAPFQLIVVPHFPKSVACVFHLLNLKGDGSGPFSPEISPSERHSRSLKRGLGQPPLCRSTLLLYAGPLRPPAFSFSPRAGPLQCRIRFPDAEVRLICIRCYSVLCFHFFLTGDQ